METLKLKEKLENLSLPWENGNENEKDKVYEQEGKLDDSLTKEFIKLAPFFLNGGYILVHKRYRVYLQQIEFYFHSEQPNGVKDDIVYHRNDYHVEGVLPYFVPITFHAHPSGYDIAFENPTEKYRASILIRAYEIYDEKYAENNADGKKFMKVEDRKFVYSHEPISNTQSTYLYDILNGFGTDIDICWIDEKQQRNSKIESPLKRKGVYKREKEEIKDKWKDPKYNIPRNRLWRFIREIIKESQITKRT